MVGEDVLITGAGPIGIMAVAICNFVGATGLRALGERRGKVASDWGTPSNFKKAKTTLSRGTKRIVGITA